MVMWLKDLQLAVIFGEVFFNVLSSLIIHDIQFGFVPFSGKFFEVFFVLGKYADIVQPGNRSCKDGIQFIVIEDKETYAAIKRHEWE